MNQSVMHTAINRVRQMELCFEALQSTAEEHPDAIREDDSLNAALQSLLQYYESGQWLQDGYLWMYRKIYSFKNIIKRVPEKKKQRAAYWMFNLFYRKWGKFSDFLCKLITYKRIGILAEKLARYL